MPKAVAGSVSASAGNPNSFLKSLLPLFDAVNLKTARNVRAGQAKHTKTDEQLIIPKTLGRCVFPSAAISVKTVLFAPPVFLLDDSLGSESLTGTAVI